MKGADESTTDLQPPMTLTAVSNLLWRERELLELLLFKLDEEHMILAAGRTRWLVHAAREVDMVLDEIKRIELERAVVLGDVSVELGAHGAATLDALASFASGPWPQIFDDHRSALVALTREISAAADANRDVLARGHEATRSAQRSLPVDWVQIDLVEEMT
jgi:hypothetical protein